MRTQCIHEGFMFVSRKVQLQANQRKAVMMRSTSFQEGREGVEIEVEVEVEGEDRWKELWVSEVLEEEAEAELEVQQETS